MKVWIATMAAFVLAAYNHPNEPATGGWMARYPHPDADELKLDLALSELVDLEKKLSPAPPRIPAYDLWHLETAPLIAEPGWMPIEGVLVGPGISFGLGFPIRPLGE